MQSLKLSFGAEHWNAPCGFPDFLTLQDYGKGHEPFWSDMMDIRKAAKEGIAKRVSGRTMAIWEASEVTCRKARTVLHNHGFYSVK